MPDPGASELVATTLRLRTGEARDNFSNSNAFFIMLKKHGAFESYSGGRDIFEPIIYDENDNFTWFEGYQILPTGYNPTVTGATFSHKQAAVSIVMSEFERLVNTGKDAVLAFATLRAKVAEDTMKNQLEASILSDGTQAGGKEMGGLGLLVPKVSTTGTVGGIDAATNPWWRNYSLPVVSTFGAAMSAATAKPIYTRALINLTRSGGTDKPTVAILGDTYYEYMSLAFDSVERATTSKELVDQGVENMVYKGVPFVLGGGVVMTGVPLFAGTDSYLLNTRYLKFRYHRDAFMEPMEEQRSLNQMATVKFLGFMGNVTVSNRRLQGRVFDS